MGLGSGIRKKPIPDPESRGQKGTGSRIPIPDRFLDSDPQHCYKLELNLNTCTRIRTVRGT
jgi:hypothetical protein